MGAWSTRLGTPHDPILTPKMQERKASHLCHAHLQFGTQPPSVCPMHARDDVPSGANFAQEIERYAHQTVDPRMQVNMRNLGTTCRKSFGMHSKVRKSASSQRGVPAMKWVPAGTGSGADRRDVLGRGFAATLCGCATSCGPRNRGRHQAGAARGRLICLDTCLLIDAFENHPAAAFGSRKVWSGNIPTNMPLVPTVESLPYNGLKTL